MRRMRPEERPEYSDVAIFTHQGISFFIATYYDYAVCEPREEKIRNLLPEDESGLWNDSAHTWARGMSLTEQRDRLERVAKVYIDEVISGEEYRVMLEREVTRLSPTIEAYLNRRDFFQARAKEDEKE